MSIICFPDEMKPRKTVVCALCSKEIPLSIEERLVGSTPITVDVAKHLYARSLCGKVAIIAERPAVFLSAVKKQWAKIERQLRHERSSTLNSTRPLEFSYELLRIQTLTFSAKEPEDDPSVGVQIATVEQFMQWAPEVMTMYITRSIAKEQLGCRRVGWWCSARRAGGNVTAIPKADAANRLVDVTTIQRSGFLPGTIAGFGTMPE